jgi:hypothetical protein
MSATTDDVFAAATTEAAAVVADANQPEPRSAESAPAVTNPDEDTTKVLDPVQKRIDELTRRRYDAERRAEQVAADRDEWRDRALRVEKPVAPAEEPATAGKTLADFAYDEAKYQAHLFKLAEERAVKAAEGVLTQKQTQEARTNLVIAHKGREASFAKNVPDYFEVAHYAPVSNSMAEIIMESDQSAALAYFLGKNPEVALSISRLSPIQQARELGRIEASKLSDVPKPPQVSGAPPPAPKIAPSNSQVEKDPKDWTDNDFDKWRKKHSK